jgi:hypothetical protein
MPKRANRKSAPLTGRGTVTSSGAASDRISLDAHGTAANPVSGTLTAASALIIAGGAASGRICVATPDTAANAVFGTQAGANRLVSAGDADSAANQGAP